ncbi:MAG: serine/threonine protein kinase [Chitinophagaceae bacterium]|nr:serine/threonine protein kinase [Chitinophagaceae bacterium]
MIVIKGNLDEYRFDKEKNQIQSGKFSNAYKAIGSAGEYFLVKEISHTSNNLIGISRFKREAAIQVSHPNLLIVKESFSFQDKQYLVRSWVNGNDLAKHAKKLSSNKIKEIILPLFEALEALHQNKILHMDVQPKNILIGVEGKIWLTDFGLSIFCEEEISQRQPFSIYYGAPEQILNLSQLFNASTDLYAVGIILYELITGQKPFYHNNPEVLMNLCLASPLPKHNIPDDWFAFILKLTAKPRFLMPPTHFTKQQLITELLNSQSERFQSANDAANALLCLSDFKRKWWVWF